MRRITTLGLFATMLGTSLPGAAADTGADNTAAVDRLFEEGRALLAANKPAEACAKFEQSIQLDPEAAGVMLNLGLCNELAGRPATALVWFRKAQVRASETELPDYEQAAKEHASALAATVPTVSIVFSPRPPDQTEVRLDGARISAVDRGRLEVDPGRHVVEASAPGKPTLRSTFEIAAGERRVVALGFEVPRKRAVPRAAYYLVGGGVGLLATGTAIGLLGRGRAEGGSRASTERWNRFADYGLTPTYAVGLACVGLGIALYVRAPLTPVVEVDQVGVAMSGRF